MLLPALLYLPQVLLLAGVQAVLGNPQSSYFADWSALTRDRQPTCVDIPTNMTLCHDIGYKKMRLPNLVDHDTLHEVSQQSASWQPLLNIKCHPDTKLFLCSLFSPVCLERPIYPCRSLCTAVREGCERRMLVYGFPWPSMLDCNKFPLDNDMCITAQATKAPVATIPAGDCTGTPCDQHVTVENILDNFCQADFVVKVGIRKVRSRRVQGKKAKVFRAWKGTRQEMKGLRFPRFEFQEGEECCTAQLKQDRKSKYLIMGKKPRRSRQMEVTFVVPWSRSKEIKRARRMFKEMNCDNLKETSQKMIVDTFAPNLGDQEDGRARRGSRSRRDRKRKQISIWDGVIH